MLKGKYFKKLHEIFSDKYANKTAISENWILRWMYIVTYPIAVFLTRCNLTPNQITTLSLISAILAFISIVWVDNLIWYAFFWSLAVLFDLCDGVVARMTGQVSKSALNFDSMSDIFKICLVSLGLSIRSSSEIVWILVFIFIFFYLYGDLLFLQYSKLQAKNIPHLVIDTKYVSDEKQRKRFSNPLINKLFSISPVLFGILLFVYEKMVETYRLLLTFNGHTLLVFIGFMDVGGLVTLSVLVYLILISVRLCWLSINGLIRIKISDVS